MFLLASGAEICFARSTLAALVAVESPALLLRSARIFSYLNDNGDALFASLTLADGSTPKIPWEANSAWRSIAALAKENLAISQGQTPDSRPSVIAA